MTLHVFNPEHDIALASGLSNFTAPHAGRQLRGDLGFLPALWAAEGDCVLVDHVASAQRTFARLRNRVGAKEVRFVSADELLHLAIDYVEPWGWDNALVAALRRKRVRDDVLPLKKELELVRQLSHRRTAARLLPLLQMEGTVGEVTECYSVDAVEEALGREGRVVVKAPWSSSGRGVRFVTERAHLAHLHNWLCNVIRRQGSVMVEPYYDKVKDFGMEFTATPEGIRYEGLSLFHTQNGAYTGNVLATEQAKRDTLSRYLPLQLLDAVREKIVATCELGPYCGPFGVDMMLVRPVGAVAAETGGTCLLHPCVEINLRRTMGHVALAVSPTDDDVRRVMRITYTTHYKLSINKL
ncbi:MAG: hypothetical protein J6O23_11205 [Prevotella sp.]|nr:hypothetical protein [Prevotella sp.]